MVRFHDARHTYVSLMLKQGVHPEVVQEPLGHSTVTVTHLISIAMLSMDFKRLSHSSLTRPLNSVVMITLTKEFISYLLATEDHV